MIPRTPLLFALGVLVVIGLAIAIVPGTNAAWLAAAGAVGALACVDFVLGMRRRAPGVTRDVAHSMALARESEVRLSLARSDPRMAARVRVFDHHPESFAANAMPQDIDIGMGKSATIAYDVRPSKRGFYEFSQVELRLASPLGWWWRRRSVALPSAVRVYPDYSRVTKLLQGVQNPLAQTGVHLRRRRGEGLEFHQLRDYREGDSLRALDWKATSRMGRLVSREYQDERNQQIVFVLDAGRRMLTRDGTLSHFDHTLNALLLLAYVALRQGDALSIMTVGERRSWLPPRKGPGAINAVLNHIYDIEPAALEIDYIAAATELSVLQRRRALVVWLTNIRDEDSDDLAQATRLLRRRHLVIMASLREAALDRSRAQPVDGLDDALAVAATDYYLDARKDAHNLLRANGVIVEDCLGGELAQTITNRYLAIKRAGML